MQHTLIDIDECLNSNSCKNGATCINNKGGFSCKCAVGFKGSICELGII